MLESTRRKKRLEWLKRRQNPHEGRSQAEYTAANRAVQKIADLIEQMLENTKMGDGTYRTFHWLPTDNFVTDDDIMNGPVTFSHWEKMLRQGQDDMGHLQGIQAPKATNRIAACWTFHNDQEQLCLEKTITSPLPCPVWGRYPLTKAQWDVLLAPLMYSHIYWQWLPAIHDRYDDTSWQTSSFHGWFMDLPNILKPEHYYGSDGTDRSGHQWPGRTFYQHVTSPFFNRLQAKATKCQS